MRTYLFIRRTVILTLLALIPWVPALFANAAELSPGVGIPDIMAVQPSLQRDTPTTQVAAQASWLDEIRNSLGVYKANYPSSNFAPYQTKLNLVGDAVSRGDRRAVKVEMGVFFTMLTSRSQGISDGAAEEVANFARMGMPVQELGIFLPRSWPDEYGTTVPRSRSWSEHSKGNHSVPSDRPLMPSLPYFPSLGRDG